MQFNEYQEDMVKLCNQEDAEGIAFELLAEAGEVAGVFQKSKRKGHLALTPEEEEKLYYELGDVLWGVAVLSDWYGFDLEEIAQANHKKLYDRLKEGTLLERPSL